MCAATWCKTQTWRMRNKAQHRDTNAAAAVTGTLVVASIATVAAASMETKALNGVPGALQQYTVKSGALVSQVDTTTTTK